jgi:Flp pilus assembly protein TadD
VCAAALDQHGADPALYHLEAFLLGASGRHAAAVAVARRALYLDRGSPLGHLALAGARAALGDDDGARAALRCAERLLAALPAAEPVPAVDADTAGELLDRVRLWLAVRG